MTFKKVFGLLLILIILAAGGIYLLKVEREDDNRMSSLYTEVEPLEREREALLQEKKTLETDYALQMRDYGTVEIMFRHLDAQIMDDIWPVMSTRGVVGVVPFSFTEMPGYYNKLTWDNVRTLLADGWGMYLLYDTGGDLAYWLSMVKAQLANYQIEFPSTIYFVNDNYSPSMDEALLAAGIRTVVTNASDGRTNTVTDVTAPLWQTGVMTWGYTTSATDIELLGRTDGANLALLMELNVMWNQGKKRSAVTDEQLASFTEVLDSWKDMLYDDSPLDELEQVGPTPNIYLDTNDSEVLHDLYLDSLTPEQQLLLPKFRSANFEKALALHLEAQEKKQNLTNERQQKEAALDRRISELDVQIAETYERYAASNDKIPIPELKK